MKKASPKAEKPAVYDHKAVEKKWQKYWESKKSFQAKEDQEKKKFYALIEFPYPSGEGLHVGHIRSNTAMDVVARKRRAEGYNVLYPIGWDAFGLPTENYAIKTGIQPAIVTKKNTDIFRKQLKALGFSFDWSREIDTTDPAYYKWTQWIFLQFLKKGLAYKKKMTINWCPKDLIGLANEEVVNGCCERCGTPVEKRDKEQWMLAITKYADRLDKDLDDVDFLERIKIQQRNWIGKSEGAEIGFPIRQKKNFVLLHGFTATPEDDFHPWLKKKLESLGYRVQVPRLPHTDNPTEKEQVDFVRSSVQFDEGTILLGHSLGSVIALKILEKLDKKIAGLVTVGGFVDTDFKDHHRNFEKTFNWNFDFNKIKSNTGFIHVLHDTNDVAIKNSQAKRLAQALGVSVHECVANDSHFTAKKEPEVLNALILQIKVFTTRPDTLFGVTYLVLAPEHPLIGELLSSVENRKEVEDYIAKSRKETDIERTDTRKEKTGVQLKGIKAINPANNEEIPVWIADYVLADYGTGAVMAVPAHDDRDWEFAKKFGLAVKEVVMPIRIDHTNPHVPGKKIVERRAIQAIVRNPKTGKILCLKWKKQPWTTFIVGGVEGNEDIVESARREVLEETGYKNLKFIRILGGTVKSEFFAAHKDENRIAYFNVIHFELENEEKNDIVSEELEKHEPIWLDVREIRPDTMQCGELDIWMHRLQSGNDASVEKGIMINSGQFNNKDSSSIKKEITEFVGGKWMTTYKLRDWIFSRQRYWGEPIPVVHCELHGIVPVPEKDLPVKLPKVKNYKPTETGESPLADISKWVNTKCPECVADKNKTKYLIFDFDGVLGDTWDASNKVKVVMGDASTVDEAAVSAIAHFDKAPSYTGKQPLTPERIKEKQEWNTTFGKHLSDEKFDLFNGFIIELKKIKNVKMAVVSSGSAQYIIPALKKSGLKFTHILAAEDHHSKEEKVERVCQDWAVKPNDIYYFTDTKADVYELENVVGRENIVGCAWGWHGYERLSELLSEKNILTDFKDIHRFFNTDCSARRETDTMPNWAGSSWYYLRYTDPKNKKAFADPKNLKYWTPVDWYNGGMEHTTLHLLYSRFWHKFLFDLGLVPTNEPYQKRTSHGLILAEGGEKMSKSKGNVINPDGIIEKVGADSLRLYEMFMGPFDQPIAWNTDNIAGVRRFIERVWKLRERVVKKTDEKIGDFMSVNKIIHKAIKKVSDDIEAMRFNTAISALMITLNELEKAEAVDSEQYGIFLQLLAPFAPHVADELWEYLGNKTSIQTVKWPTFDPTLAVDNQTTIVVQINGKMRGSFTAAMDAHKEELEKSARAIPEAAKWLEGKQVIKIVIVPNKLVNIVV